MQAAWAAPVVAVAVAAPGAAASVGTPELTFSAFALDDDYAWGTVTFERSGVTDLSQTFDFQGSPPVSWENIYTGQSTNSSGYYASTLPRVVIGNYDEIRAAAFVEGYGWTVSNAVPLSSIWA